MASAQRSAASRCDPNAQIFLQRAPFVQDLGGSAGDVAPGVRIGRAPSEDGVSELAVGQHQGPVRLDGQPRDDQGSDEVRSGGADRAPLVEVHPQAEDRGLLEGLDVRGGAAREEAGRGTRASVRPPAGPGSIRRRPSDTPAVPARSSRGWPSRSPGLARTRGFPRRVGRPRPRDRAPAHSSERTWRAWATASRGSRWIGSAPNPSRLLGCPAGSSGVVVATINTGSGSRLDIIRWMKRAPDGLRWTSSRTNTAGTDHAEHPPQRGVVLRLNHPPGIGEDLQGPRLLWPLRCEGLRRSSPLPQVSIHQGGQAEARPRRWGRVAAPEDLQPPTVGHLTQPLSRSGSCPIPAARGSMPGEVFRR